MNRMRIWASVGVLVHIVAIGLAILTWISLVEDVWGAGFSASWIWATVTLLAYYGWARMSMRFKYTALRSQESKVSDNDVLLHFALFLVFFASYLLTEWTGASAISQFTHNLALWCGIASMVVFMADAHLVENWKALQKVDA